MLSWPPWARWEAWGWPPLLLTFFGDYSLVSYAMVQRSRGIGVRMALGAGPADIARAFLLRSVVPAAWGLAAGVTASALLTGALETLLFGIVPPTRPRTPVSCA